MANANKWLRMAMAAAMMGSVSSAWASKGDTTEIEVPGVKLAAKGDTTEIEVPGVKLAAKGDTTEIEVPGLA
jgi:hypothetical protein